MKLGIMQGRLLPPVNGHIQEFPHKEWGKELYLIDSLGLHGIEWLITEKSFPNNPILTNEFQYDKIISVCLDVLVTKHIHDSDFLEKVLSKILSFNIKTVTVPILEDSNMSNDGDRLRFIHSMCNIADKNPSVIFSFESELNINKLSEIVNERDSFKVTYDTGNITSCRIDHSQFVSTFKDKINNVHLKDRTINGQTVCPTHGDTDFELIFRLLKEVNYDGTFILQTARNGSEQQTITNNINLFKKMYYV